MADQQTAIAPYQGGNIIRSYDDAERAAKAMAASGYFQDAHQAAQAVVKILAGSELGFGPFAAMSGVYIISGRPSIGANLMAAAVKKSGRYNYRIVEMSEKSCSIDFYEGSEKIGNSTFTLEDGRKAGTKNLDKYPRNMLFARAISNGVKWFCPDVFNGSPVYTPEELGANVNEDGEVIEAPFTSAPTTNQPAEITAPTNGNGKKQAAPEAPKTPADPTAKRWTSTDYWKHAQDLIKAGTLTQPEAQKIAVDHKQNWEQACQYLDAINADRKEEMAKGIAGIPSSDELEYGDGLSEFEK